VELRIYRYCYSSAINLNRLQNNSSSELQLPAAYFVAHVQSRWKNRKQERMAEFEEQQYTLRMNSKSLSYDKGKDTKAEEQEMNILSCNGI
jgi:hypothetical protein